MKLSTRISLAATMLILVVALVLVVGTLVSGSVRAQSEPEIASIIRNFEQQERNGEIAYFDVMGVLRFDTNDETSSSYIATEISYSVEVICFTGSDTSTERIFQDCIPYNAIQGVSAVTIP